MSKLTSWRHHKHHGYGADTCKNCIERMYIGEVRVDTADTKYEGESLIQLSIDINLDQPNHCQSLSNSFTTLHSYGCMNAQ